MSLSHCLLFRKDLFFPIQVAEFLSLEHKFYYLRFSINVEFVLVFLNITYYKHSVTFEVANVRNIVRIKIDMVIYSDKQCQYML